MGRIEGLPPALRPAARALKRRLVPGYRWQADGYATDHLSPFLEDTEWDAAWRRASAAWFGDEGPDLRWRLWVLTTCARNAQHLPGAFAEFGTFRGGCASMVLARTDDTPMWLYDTFGGIPESGLAPGESGLGGGYADTSPALVRSLLAPWEARVRLVEGDVFDTVPAIDPGPLALVHLDLNAAAPTLHALEFAWERLVAGGVLVLDDYGWDAYAEQRAVIDGFFTSRRESVLAIPTGQALVVRLPG